MIATTKVWGSFACVILLWGAWANNGADVAQATKARPPIVTIEPPEKEFFSKLLVYEGIPIKAPAVVSDEALYAARDRMAMLLEHLPTVTSNLVKRAVELHIIGKDQVTTDLPEWRKD